MHEPYSGDAPAHCIVDIPLKAVWVNLKSDSRSAVQEKRAIIPQVSFNDGDVCRVFIECSFRSNRMHKVGSTKATAKGSVDIYIISLHRFP